MDQEADALAAITEIDVAGLFQPQQDADLGEVRLQDFSNARCAFLRLAAAGPISFLLDGVTGLERPPGGGWLVKLGTGQPSLWLPALPMLRRIDADGHVQQERTAVLVAAQLQAGSARVTLNAPPAGWVLDMALWRLPQALAEELRSPSALERQPAYLWGSHTVFGQAADLHRHLVHARVHENRYAWPFKIRVFSENDAHALSVQLTGLRRASGQVPGRALPAVLGLQMLQSVLARIGPDGAFRHGVWTDRMESHYRLHCSAMHLMMDHLSESPDAAVQAALRAAAGFLAQQHERIAAGVWFFHDELEHSLELMRIGPFKWVPSTALGKRESNMLVLNTQLDCAVALDRYAQLTGDSQHAELVASARNATRAVLSLRGADFLYRLLFAAIGLTFLPTEQAQRLPVWQRALKRVAWKYLIPRMPDIKARFPRLVMPGGYIDRELTLRTWAHDYHAINLMDLARYLRRFDEPVVRQVLVQGLEFTRRSGILQRWRELDYQKYALGFWAEALYHVCTLFPEARYRQWPAEAMQVLEELQMGQPPSLLGANAEAVPVADQLPCPSPADPRLRIANLGRRGAPECLVVNATDTELPLQWETAPAFAVEFHVGGSNAPAQLPLSVPARGWLWGRAAK